MIDRIVGTLLDCIRTDRRERGGRAGLRSMASRLIARVLVDHCAVAARSRRRRTRSRTTTDATQGQLLQLRVLPLKMTQPLHVSRLELAEAFAPLVHRLLADPFSSMPPAYHLP